MDARQHIVIELQDGMIEAVYTPDDRPYDIHVIYKDEFENDPIVESPILKGYYSDVRQILPNLVNSY